MSGWNAQRKPGTTRGSPRRSRTAKASRISCHAVKSRCAHEWGGWGRLSDDGPGHYNPDPSEGPWGGGLITLHGGAQSSPRPDTVRDNRGDHEVHEGRMQTGHRTANAGSWLKPLIIGKAPLGKPAFQPYWGKPAVRNDRGDRGNVGIIRSPIRASILPDYMWVKTLQGRGTPRTAQCPLRLRDPIAATRRTDASGQCTKSLRDSPLRGVPWLNPHSACGSAGASPTAISCLGAFWTPAASVGGGARHRRRPKNLHMS